MLIYQNERRLFSATMTCASALLALLLAVLVPGIASAGLDPPAFWDAKRRPEKPDMRGVRQIRFLTEDEYPPFDFTGASGQLEGFNVDIARAVCTELAVPCTIQARRWDTIVAALEAGQGDAIVASLAITPEARARLAFTEPYFRSPARFASRTVALVRQPGADSLTGKTVAVTAGTAHEAFLRAYFPGAQVRPMPSDVAARDSLKAGEVDALFGDGVALAYWINGSSSGRCCELVGGPYLESRFFGEGIAIALRPEDATLHKALEHALFRLWETGAYADIFRRWFPVSPYAPGP
jgi:polar amino acid transport system substrate-binding protein